VTTPPINLTDLEAIAASRLERNAFDYYGSGAHDEITLRENRSAFDRIPVHYRVLVDVSKRDLSTTVLGCRISMPVMIAPTAFHRMACEDGELATARAAGAADTIMILSSLSNTRVEDVVLASSGPVWFQLYVYEDRGATEALVARAEAAGARAIAVTVDAPQLGTRERDVRNRFHLPEGLRVENLVAEGYGKVGQPPADSGLAAYFASLIDASFSWKDLAWLRSITKLPILVKGVVRADDARRAVEEGVNGVVVSNHGGRQLDTSPATIDVLPAIAEAVDGRAEVLLDGGVRRGTDVLKAVARGAKAVLIGRPILWGLAYDGEAGAKMVLDTLRAELDLAMTLAGAPTIEAITLDLLAP
jgi:4-hydroxymandelate oxidase